MNYNNDKGRPIKKGRMSDVIKSKKRLFSRQSRQSKIESINEMKLDLVHILTNVGIVLSNTHSISSQLIHKGWIKTTKIERDI